MANHSFSRMRKLSWRTTPKSVAIYLAGVLLLGVVGTGGYVLGRGGSNVQPDSRVNFGLFWQSWDLINKNFYGSADDTKRVDGAISGMAAAAGDPYTVYLPPEQSKQLADQLQGSFGGIGAELEMRDSVVTVVAPLQGTPAEKAGILAKDVIVMVDDTDTAGKSLNDVISKIRGEVGTEVKLLILRSGADAPLELTLTRDKITLPNLKAEWIGTDSKVAYLRIASFTADSGTEARAQISEIIAQNPRGLVLDLRNNPGGYVRAATDVIGALVPNQKDLADSKDSALRSRSALLERDKQGKEEQVPATGDNLLSGKKIPVMVVMNGGSASASEIVAGALRDYGVAKLVGTKSFGKGSEQVVFPLDNGGSMKITVRNWFTPLGVGINGEGLTPDTVVELPQGTKASSSDAQVARALELIP